MCYSAQAKQHYREYVREFGAKISMTEFAKLYGYKPMGIPANTPKAMDAIFQDPQTPEEREIKAILDAYNKTQAEEWQAEIFKQSRRLADAERALAKKETKKALTDIRVAPSKIKQLKRWLSDLNRTELTNEDSRIFPGTYCPVMIWENGERVVKPMRYRCRIEGWTAKIEKDYDGTYNARRDKLEKSWGNHFGIKHGLIVVTAFWENVERHRVEGRELGPEEKPENLRLEFRPRPTQDMLIACVWSDWSYPDEPDLLSFAAITDEPPPEVAATGHDRCIIPIKRENIDAWLQPDGDLAKCYAILDDRERPYYEHRMAA